MEEDKVNHEEKQCGRKNKQQITVPFQWEEAPGAPKKDWNPKRSYEPVTDLVPLLVKYVASVPFKWEEKPGTPLRTFARDSTKPKTELMELENKSLPLPPGYFSKYEDDDSNGDSSYDDREWMSELEFEAMSVQSEESFYSAPSNRVTPPRNPYVEQQSHGCDHTFEGPFSSENSKSPVNYADGNASLKGADFLAHLFPLYPPKSGFLNKGKNPAEKTEVPGRKPTFLEEHKEIIGDGRRNGVIRRQCTLGELIMQSRRRSYRRKAVHMKKHNQQKSFAKNKPQGCCYTSTGGGLLWIQASS